MVGLNMKMLWIFLFCHPWLFLDVFNQVRQTIIVKKYLRVFGCWLPSTADWSDIKDTSSVIKGRRRVIQGENTAIKGESGDIKVNVLGLGDMLLE